MEANSKQDPSDITRIQHLFEEAVTPMLITKKQVTALGDEVLVIIRKQLGEHQKAIANLGSEYNDEIAKVKKQARIDLESAKAEYEKYRQELIDQFAALKEEITKTANDQRKHAAARGNRFKRQYDDLLNVLDGVLPGAKHLIENRAISEKEKQRRLKKLNAQIETQQGEVGKYIGDYNPKYKTNDLLQGYGKERKILDTLRRRNRKLAAKVTYD